MIERTFNKGCYLYNYNNQGEESLNLLIRRKGQDFTDDEILQVVDFIRDEIHSAVTIYRKWMLSTLYETLFYQVHTEDTIVFNKIFRAKRDFVECLEKRMK